MERRGQFGRRSPLGQIDHLMGIEKKEILDRGDESGEGATQVFSESARWGVNPGDAGNRR